jgi:hypothetical protein
VHSLKVEDVGTPATLGSFAPTNWKKKIAVCLYATWDQ